MIEFKNVTKRYGRFGTALEGIDLTIDTGQFVFVTGSSGAGKSTLLKLLYAAEQPTTGDVLIEGRSVARLHPRSVPYLRRNLGVVFQDFKLLPQRTVIENVALPLEVTGTPRAEIAARVTEVIKQVGLKGRGDRRPGELSGGEQQRVAIARAVVGKPSIVIADEPTGNLDAALTHEIFELLVKLHEQDGTTVLVATHDTVELDHWNFRRIALRDGRLEPGGTDSLPLPPPAGAEVMKAAAGPEPEPEDEPEDEDEDEDEPDTDPDADPGDDEPDEAAS